MLLKTHLHLKNLSNSSSGPESKFITCEDIHWGTQVWASCSMLCFAVGFPACAAILWEMFKTHRSGTPFTPYEFLMLNLSTMDAVFLAFIPPGLLNYFIWHIWLIDIIWNSIYALSICGRPFMMACICVDCYVAVVHPITYYKKKSLTPRVVVVGIVWAVTFAVGIICASFSALAFSMLSVVIFLIAVVIIVISDSFIVYTLIKSDSDRKNIHPQKQRALQTLIYSLVMTIISYLPPIILLTVGKVLISNPINFLCSIILPVTISSTSGSAVMPFLNLHNSGKLGYFRLRCCKPKPQISASETVRKN